MLFQKQNKYDYLKILHLNEFKLDNQKDST